MTRSRVDLAEIRRLETLGRASWPSLEVAHVGGWSVGMSGRYTRRANCVAAETEVATSSADLSIDQRIEAIERLCRARSMAAVFKLTDAARPTDLDSRLARRGYGTDGETLTSTLDVDAVLVESAATSAPRGTMLEVAEARAPEGWFEASMTLSRVPGVCGADYAALLERCRSTQSAVLFGQAERAGEIVCVAMASVIGEIVSFVQVATAESARGDRLADSVIRQLLFAARERGAKVGLLSVEAENLSARRLYERLGFEERYRYWYREREPAV